MSEHTRGVSYVYHNVRLKSHAFVVFLTFVIMASYTTRIIHNINNLFPNLNMVTESDINMQQINNLLISKMILMRTIGGNIGPCGDFLSEH